MTGSEALAIAMFGSFIVLILTGFPVAWVLGGLAVLFTALAIVMEIDLGIATGVDWNYTSIAIERIWGVMGNWVMVALPMFIFMGLMLDQSGVAQRMRFSGVRRRSGSKGSRGPRSTPEGCSRNVARDMPLSA